MVYQPVYPRSAKFRLSFFLKRVGEVIGLSIAIWFLSAQYAVPLLRNSLHAMDKLNLPVILERLMKLSTISLVIWLAGFVVPMLAEAKIKLLTILIGSLHCSKVD